MKESQNNNGKKRLRRAWLQWSNLLAAASGLAVVGLAAKRFRRPRDIRWLDHTHILHHAMASNFRVVDGVRIHYQEKIDDPKRRATAETMVLLHGFCSSNYTWKDCMLPLATAGYRVIAPDLKGFGFSEKPADQRYDITDQAKLIIGLLDSLGVEQATFIGNSYGGAVSMACALRNPDRVKQLVLVDAVHNNGALGRRPIYVRMMRTRGVAEVFGPLLFGSPRLVRHYLSNMYHDKTVVTEERYHAYHRPLRAASCQAAAITTMRQWEASWLEQELSAIAVPTLIIWGEYDWALPVEWGAELHLAMPNSQFIVIPNCGHLPQEERPEETCAFILDFCAMSSPATVGGQVWQIER
ncbi:MAG: alpha/beta hydrolase [Acidobacteriota bacterium]